LFGFDIPLGVGPVIDNGFYQDFDYSLSPEHFELIEQEMTRIIEENIQVGMKLLPLDAASAFFYNTNNITKRSC
jgi:threonyl-tRNA synthetase